MVFLRTNPQLDKSKIGIESIVNLSSKHLTTFCGFTDSLGAGQYCLQNRRYTPLHAHLYANACK